MSDIKKILNPKYISPLIICIFLLILIIYQGNYLRIPAADMTTILKNPDHQNLEIRIREFADDQGEELNNIAHVIEAIRIYKLFSELKSIGVEKKVIASQFWRGTLRSYNICIKNISEESALALTMEFMWKTENWQSNQGFQGVTAHFSSKTKRSLFDSLTSFKMKKFSSMALGAFRASYIASASGWCWNDPLLIGSRISELKGMSDYEYVREMDMKNDWLGARMIDIIRDTSIEDEDITKAYEIALDEWNKSKSIIIKGRIPDTS